MKIKFPTATVLTLEQKTDGSYTEDRRFKCNEVVEVEEVFPDNDNSPDWITIVFPRETGWLATGVHKDTIVILSEK